MRHVSRVVFEADGKRYFEETTPIHSESNEWRVFGNARVSLLLYRYFDVYTKINFASLFPVARVEDVFKILGHSESHFVFSFYFFLSAKLAMKKYS